MVTAGRSLALTFALVLASTAAHAQTVSTTTGAINGTVTDATHAVLPGVTITTYNYNTLFDPVDWCLSSPDDRACVVGRKPYGRISIANADAAGSSHTDAAIDMAYRAVGEVVESRTRQHLSQINRLHTD